MKAAKFVSPYLKAKDVKEEQVLTIASASTETFKDEEKGERNALVLYFKEIEQGVVLCRESVGQLIEICGTDETDDWIGKKVILFHDGSVKYMGKKVGGLRFRAA